MPYKARKDSRCPASKPWGVVKTTDDELMGCHISKGHAMDQVQALYANEAARGMDMDSDALVIDAVEQRDFETTLEFRAGEEGIQFSGYAAVWDLPSRPMPFTEQVAPGAFTRSLRTDKDIRLLVDHNPERLLASRTAGTLNLTEDDKGLYVEADLAPTSYARDLKVLSDRGEIRSMSFAFKPTAKGESWSEDGKMRTLKEVRLFEVSILTGHQPAYPQTTAFIRSLADNLSEDEGALAGAILALAHGQPISEEEARLLEEMITTLRPAPVVPFAVHQRRALLLGKT